MASRRTIIQFSHTTQSLLDKSTHAARKPCTGSFLLKQSVLCSRPFSSTTQQRIQEFFPPPENAPHIKITPPAWKHPTYTEDQMKSIEVAHRQTQNWADRVALSMVRLLRFVVDTATGYTHDKESVKPRNDSNTTSVANNKTWFTMTERKWLIRFLFLESVAGVPGMVGASLRHLHSLRRLKRDNGWIETLLEEAYNERMHLLTFMKMAEPGRFMKFMILGAQGVFYNGFFLSYLVSPRICHRFVGHLEEEAVLTYTRAISDIDAGKLPKWEKLEAPEIAVRYWNMPEGNRTMRDLLLYIRADEAKHREVNHTLGNLHQKTDPNPFVSEYEDPSKPHPSKGIENIKRDYAAIQRDGASGVIVLSIRHSREAYRKARLVYTKIIIPTAAAAATAADAAPDAAAAALRLPAFGPFMRRTMPPRSSLTSSFSASDVNNEVVCPLKNHDGSNCRKRCLGEKRYRSMQEHIRRAHPEHYISKLPATEESFQLMITTPPTEKPPAPQNQSIGNIAFGHEREAAKADYSSSPAAARNLSEYPAAATAAVALAQLHSHRPDSDWESEADYVSENERSQPNTQSSIELPPIQNHVNPDNMPPFHSPRPRELLPSIMARSPPGSGGRSSTLPPIHRRDKAARPRKSSITQNNRKPKTERPKSKEYARRLSIEGRKAFSAEPQAVGKRWEDLIEAATSANEADSDRDLTPIPQSPSSVKRSSLPPFSSMVPHSDAYKASPLQNALTPPPPDERGVEPFPSIESAQSSLTSGHNFHMHPSGLTNSEAGTSPTLPPHPVQIYCAHCRRISNLKESYACTECISGFCSDCVYTLSSEQNRGRGCPRCQVLGPRYKAFQLDLR